MAFASGRHRRDSILNMLELMPLLVARSVDLKTQSSNLAPFRLPTWLVGPMMGLAPKLAKSFRVLIDVYKRQLHGSRWMRKTRCLPGIFPPGPFYLGC